MTEDLLIDVLENRLHLRNITRRGRNIMASCPSGSHQDRRPSWGINTEAPHWHGCFSCGFKGTLSTLLMQVGNMSMREARLICGEEEGFINAKQLRILDKQEPTKQDKEIEEMREYALLPYYPCKRSDTYAELRGLSLKTIRECELVFDKREKRLLFPWYYEGKLLNVTGRTLIPSEARTGAKNKGYIPGVNKRELIYVPARKIAREPLIIVEGEFDALKVYEAGFHNVAAICHARLSEGQKNLMLNSACTEFWAFTDMDKAGFRVSLELERTLSKFRPFRRISYKPVAKHYEHLRKDGKLKLDPATLSIEDINTIVTPKLASLFPRWQ